MKSLSEIKLTDFQDALTPSSIRVFQIIYIAFFAGVLAFSFVIYLVHLRQTNIVPNYKMISTINIMSWINILITISMIFIGKVVADRQYSKSNLEDAVNRNFKDKVGKLINLTPGDKTLSIIRTSLILRLATLNGAAFFGLVTLMLAVRSGIIDIEPIYYANVLSVLPLLIYFIITFPTVEKLENVFKIKIQSAI